MVQTFYFYNIISLLLLCYLLILSMPQVFEQSLFLFFGGEGGPNFFEAGISFSGTFGGGARGGING